MTDRFTLMCDHCFKISEFTINYKDGFFCMYCVTETLDEYTAGFEVLRKKLLDLQKELDSKSKILLESQKLIEQLSGIEDIKKGGGKNEQQ